MLNFGEIFSDFRRVQKPHAHAAAPCRKGAVCSTFGIPPVVLLELASSSARPAAALRDVALFQWELRRPHLIQCARVLQGRLEGYRGIVLRPKSTQLFRRRRRLRFRPFVRSHGLRGRQDQSSRRDLNSSGSAMCHERKESFSDARNETGFHKLSRRSTVCISAV